MPRGRIVELSSVATCRREAIENYWTGKKRLQLHLCTIGLHIGQQKCSSTDGVFQSIELTLMSSIALGPWPSTSGLAKLLRKPLLANSSTSLVLPRTGRKRRSTRAVPQEGKEYFRWKKLISWALS